MFCFHLLGLSPDEIKERVLQSMLEAGATPEAIAKVMVQQELLNVIGKSPEDLSKQLLKQLRSGEDKIFHWKISIHFFLCVKMKLHFWQF